MGLLKASEGKELRELLSGMFNSSSTMTWIDRIADGTFQPGSGFGDEVVERIDKASATIRRMVEKGKRQEAEAILDEFAAKPFPSKSLTFRAEEPTKEAFAAAAAEALERFKVLPDDPQYQAERERQWRLAVSEVRNRAGISVPSAR